MTFTAYQFVDKKREKRIANLFSKLCEVCVLFKQHGHFTAFLLGTIKVIRIRPRSPFISWHSSTDISPAMSSEQTSVPPLNVTFKVIEKTLEPEFKHDFPGYVQGLYISEPGNFVMTPAYAQNAEKIYQLEPRSDDVWLVTFPKCGTTWTSELLWLLVNDCDFERAKQIPLIARTPFPEMPYLSSRLDHEKISPGKMATKVEDIEKMPSPRVIRPHLPFYLLHPKLLDTAKVVYVARNPKDAIVSYYFHHKHIHTVHGFEGDIEKFAEYFMNDEVMYSPYFPQILDAWSKRNHPNLHFMWFEDMKQDLRGEIAKVAQFLEKSLTEEQLDKLTEHLRFDNFEKNPAVNNETPKKMGLMSADGKFLRKGKTGDWKNHFSPEFNEKIDAWIEKNLANTDLKFVTELEHQD